MSKKSDERIVFDEEKDARFARFLRENEYLIAHIDCLLLHKFLKLMCMGRNESAPRGGGATAGDTLVNLLTSIMKLMASGFITNSLEKGFHHPSYSILIPAVV